MDGLQITLEKREVIGKKVSNLRKNGLIPVHLYGSEVDSISLQCESLVLNKIVLQAGTNIPINVSIDGTEDQVCFVREVQYHPVKDQIIHVDFMSVNISKPVRARVPVRIEGTSPAVRTMGGTLLQPLESVTVAGLPLEIPGYLSMAAELLVDFETNLYVRDLEIPDGIEIINNESEMLASVVAPRVERERGTQSEESGESGESGESEESEESEE
ncbi:MAG: 50S ribosomal protein L25 [Dehalococcoidia bacterium]